MTHKYKKNPRSELTKNQDLDYPFVPPSPDGTAVKVAEGILWIRMPMPMALDHINLYLLEDKDGWFIVDTGLHTDDTKSLWDVVAHRYCATKPIKGLICTHFHYDHSSLATWLMDKFNVPLYMTYGEFFTSKASTGLADAVGSDAMTIYYLRAGVPQDITDKIFDACKQDPYLQYSPPAFRRIEQDDILTIGDRKWSIVIGKGHSPEHACLLCKDEDLLISGDQLLPQISSNVLVNELEPMGNPLKTWLESLENLQALKASTLVLPAHGPVFRNLRTRTQQLIQHHNDVLDKLKQYAVRHSNFNAFEAMNHLFNRSLSPINLLMALGETIAHLNYLELDGILQCDRSNPSNDSYQLLQKH